MAAEEGRTWQLVMVLAACLFSPLIVWGNSTERAGVLGFLVIGAGLLGLGLAARFLLLRLGGDPLGSTYAVALFLFCFTNLGLILGDPLERWMLVILCLAVGTIGYRLRGLRIWRLSLAWGAVAVLAYPLLLGAGKLAQGSEVTLAEQPALVADFTAEKRDVVLIALDAYTNSDVLEELYRFDNGPFEAELAGSGFEVSDAVANYGRTRFSISSVVQLDYPVPEGGVSSADLDRLLQYVGGANRLADWLQSEGYEQVYVESGWFGTRCESEVDTCVSGPLPDESFYDVMHRSLLQNLPGFETGRSFSRGAQHVLAWLRQDLESLLINDQPEVVYAHVLAPHPPLFLDRECVMRAQEGFSGFTIATPGMSESELDEARGWYVEQMICVNDALTEVARLAESSDTIMLMFGDHGPDSLGQLYVSGSKWDEAQRRERLGAFLAARAPGCDMTQIESLVNVGRRLVTCLSDSEYPDLPTRTYDFEFVGSNQNIKEIQTPKFDG